MIRSIEAIDAKDFADMRLAVYAGNLKRGAQIRELRTSLQVTQKEMQAELEYVFGGLEYQDPKRVPCSDCSVSWAERGIVAMTDRTFFAYKAAVNVASRQEGAKDRRKLVRRLERAESKKLKRRA